MTVQETGLVMDILNTAFPKSCRSISKDDQKKTLAFWASMFADDDAKLVIAAVKALITSKTDDWPPSIGAVKEKISFITAPDAITEMEAWQLVVRAIQRGGSYGAVEEFKKLPPEVQRALGGPNTLVHWGQINEQEFHTVVASNFQRSFKAITKAQKDYQALPADVKKLALEIGNNLAMADGRNCPAISSGSGG